MEENPTEKEKTKHSKLIIIPKDNTRDASGAKFF